MAFFKNIAIPPSQLAFFWSFYSLPWTAYEKGYTKPKKDVGGEKVYLSNSLTWKPVVKARNFNQCLEFYFVWKLVGNKSHLWIKFLPSGVNFHITSILDLWDSNFSICLAILATRSYIWISKGRFYACGSWFFGLWVSIFCIWWSNSCLLESI